VYSAEKPLASNRHLAIFGAICVAILAAGVSAQLRGSGASLDPGHRGVVSLYLSTMAAEWFLLYFTWRGVRAQGYDLFAFVGRWKSFSGAGIDLALGVVVAFVILLADSAVHHVIQHGNAKSIDQLLPQGPLEISLWLGVSITAGVVEEIVFRGYLTNQLAARFHNVPAAIVAQGLWFGGMHAYEGLQSVVSICAIGITFGIFAMWRKQLRTNIVGHSVVDIVAGLFPHVVN
jgi:membrane protease YdiL (CAAX protease family)